MGAAIAVEGVQVVQTRPWRVQAWLLQEAKTGGEPLLLLVGLVWVRVSC